MGLQGLPLLQHLRDCSDQQKLNTRKPHHAALIILILEYSFLSVHDQKTPFMVLASVMVLAFVMVIACIMVLAVLWC